MDTSAPHLPPGWQADPTLEHLLPSYVDWREFRRLPENPARYAASVCGAGVWDFHDIRLLTPRVHEGRRRYRLNLGPNSKPVVRAYSRLIAFLAFGPPPRPDSEAHHQRGIEAGDHWQNLRWQSPAQNRAVETERREAKRRLGQANGKTTLTAKALDRFIRQHDEDRRKGLILDWWWYAFLSNVSERQLRRIAKGQSRKEEVAAIRKHIKSNPEETSLKT